MKTEKSCGAVVFTRDKDGIKYTIIESISGVFGFPKGHIENGETEKETALREILEETALSVTLIGDFRQEESYTFKRGSKNVSKINIYFLAEYSGGTPVAQETELRGVYTLDYKTALSRFQFDSLKRILTEAHNYLMGG